MLSPDSSIAFHIGSFPIKFYSLTMLLAIISGTLLTCFVAKKYYKDVCVNKILDMIPPVIISAVIGARVYYVLLDWGYFSKHLNEIFAVWNGGISIHGALIGGFLAGFYYTKKYKLDLWSYADVFSYGLILGQAIGRFGNYFNIEAFGKPCFYSTKMCLYIPTQNRPQLYSGVEYFHPTFLYEAFWNIFVLLILFFVIKNVAKDTKGIVFFSYLILYSLGRIFIESIRLDSVLNVGSIHIAGLVSIVIIAFSTLMIFLLKKSQSITK